MTWRPGHDPPQGPGGGCRRTTATAGRPTKAASRVPGEQVLATGLIIEQLGRSNAEALLSGIPRNRFGRLMSQDESDPFDLNRFISAHKSIFDIALAELRGGQKRSHWMWFSHNSQ